MNVIFTTSGTRFEIRSGLAGTSIEGSERIKIHSTQQALFYLQQPAINTVTMTQMRTLCGPLQGLAVKQSDHDVLRHVANALSDGALHLFKPAILQRQAPAVRRASKGAGAFTAPMRSAWPPPRPQPPPRVPNLEPAMVEVNVLDHIDHDAQAGTLENAARNGTPFCAVCQRHAMQRAAA